MKTLYLDCSSGISGDMFLAGLVDLGLNLLEIETALQKAGLDVSLVVTNELRCGCSGKLLHVRENSSQSLRHLPDILTILDKLSVSNTVVEKSKFAFQRLAEVEGKVHGVEVSAIHFHEVGAMDTIVDIVGVFWGLEQLGVGMVHAGSLPWFQGRVQCAHGLLPLPAPAVVELLRGKPVHPTPHQVELITPTGAVLLDRLVHEFNSGPRGRLLGCGMGLGSMELGTQPNVLRCFLVQSSTAKSGGFDEVEDGMVIEEVVVLETNIDHLTGEELGECFEVLLQEGALDVLFLPGVMKKNRPGGKMQVICRPEHVKTMQRAVFRQTLSLGVRRQRVERVVLSREDVVKNTSVGPLEYKQTYLEDQGYSRPEFAALQKLSRRTGRSVAQLRYLLQTPEKDDTPECAK